MSSPVVNKDTLYFYEGRTKGKYYMGFCHVNKKDMSEGWGRHFKSFETKGFNFKQSRAYSGTPIGQRCILQW